MAQGRRGAAPNSASYRNRVAQQQAVLDQLRSGGSINLYSSNPLAAGVEKLRNFLTGAEQPSAKATRLPDGREALMVPGGWGTDDKPNSALIPREVNVGGQRWFLGQQGQNAVYTRGPGLVGGQYGSIFPSEQTASVEPGKTLPGAQPPAASPAAKLSPEELAYNQERSRIAQLTAQNPEFQNIDQLRNNLRDQGMAIWAAKYGGPDGLASKVKPGQSGYDVIQGTLAGQAAAQGYGYQMPQQIIPTPPPAPNVPQGLPTVQSFGAAETYGPQGLQVDPEMAKKFQLLLNQANK